MNKSNRRHQLRQPHQARKRFGQNFLHDGAIIAAIVAAVNPQAGDTVVEIGPGQGALTGQLLASGATLQALEIDRDLAADLRQRYADTENFSLVETDVLRFDFASLDTTPLRLVGNLPYNISTPLLFRLLQQRALFSDMVFMLQSEVVDRLVAAQGSKAYGRIAVMLQSYFTMERVLSVPPSAFRPAPKVQSAVVRLRPLTASPACDYEVLEQLVKQAFAQRRKTLKNNLGKLFAHCPDALSEHAKKRAEELSVQDFQNLAQQLVGADSC